MKRTPYIDVLQTILPHNEWESFLEAYSKPLSKSITIMRHAWISGNLIHERIDWLSRPGQHFLHQGWFFYIQEQAASLPAQVLLASVIANETKQSEGKEPEIILDMCAAPWGKSIQLADGVIDSWFIVSNEPSNARCKALIFNINRTWCYNTMITNYDGTRIWTLFPETFDKVLIDAPCSWEGMNYKIAIQQSRDELKIKNIAATQYQLLKSWILACKTGWTIVYSTCTLNPIENEWVIANIMQEFSWKIELENVDIPKKSTGIDTRGWPRCPSRAKRIIESNQASKLARFRPHRNNIGGFFIAKIKKIAKTEVLIKTSWITSQFGSSSTLQSEVRHHLQEEFGIEKNEDYFFISTPNNIYITSSTYQNLPDSLKNNAWKIGIPIYDIWRTNNRIPNHHLWNILGHLATKNVIELTDQQAQDYSDHKDIPTTPTDQSKFIILTRKTFGFSIGKIVDGRVKNKMI